MTKFEQQMAVVTRKHHWTWWLLSTNSKEFIFIYRYPNMKSETLQQVQNDATHELGLHHIICTCSLHPDLMRGGRMEPADEASNRPQTSCSPLWKMEVNGRENDILLSETLQFAADHRKLHVAKSPQKKLQNRERESAPSSVDGGSSGKCMRWTRPIILRILNLFIYKSAPFWVRFISICWRELCRKSRKTSNFICRVFIQERNFKGQNLSLWADNMSIRDLHKIDEG